MMSFGSAKKQNVRQEVEVSTLKNIPQHVVRSLVPQKSSSPEDPDGFFAQESVKILNQPEEEPTAVEASDTLAKYTDTGP